MLYALLVGVQEFKHPDIPPLMGAVSDVYAVEDVLREVFSDQITDHSFRRLLNRNATRQGFFEGFDYLRQAGPGDQVLLYFSGHGSRALAAPELASINDGPFDETLVLYDSRVDAPEIHDKELAVLFSELAANGPELTAWLDCCHSGSMFRSTIRFKTAMKTDAPRALETYYGEWDREHPELPRVRMTVMSACAKWEVAAENPLLHRGAFTLALEKALQTHADLTYRDLHRYARVAIQEFNPDQTPQLESPMGADPHRLVLGGASPQRPPLLAVAYEAAETYQQAGHYLGLGVLQGLPADPPTAELTLWDGDTVLGTARLAEVGIEKSRLTLDFDPGDHQFMTATWPGFQPDFELVRVVGEAAETVTAAWKAEAYPFVELWVGGGEAEVELRWEGGSWKMFDAARKRWLFFENPPDWPDQLKIWHRYRCLLRQEGDLSAVGNEKVFFRWQIGPAHQPELFLDQDLVLDAAPNQTTFPVQLALLGAGTGKRFWYLFYLDRSPSIQLLAGDSWAGRTDWFTVLDADLTLKNTLPGGQESIKLLISDRPVDAFALIPAGQSAAPQMRSGGSGAIPFDGWAAPNFHVHLARRQPVGPDGRLEMEGGVVVDGLGDRAWGSWRDSLPLAPSPDRAETGARILRELETEPLAWLEGEAWHFQVLELGKGSAGSEWQIDLPGTAGTMVGAVVWDGEECFGGGVGTGDARGRVRIALRPDVTGRNSNVGSDEECDSVWICFFIINRNPLDFVGTNSTDFRNTGLFS